MLSSRCRGNVSVLYAQCASPPYLVFPKHSTSFLPHTWGGAVHIANPTHDGRNEDRVVLSVTV